VHGVQPELDCAAAARALGLEQGLVLPGACGEGTPSTLVRWNGEAALPLAPAGRHLTGAPVAGAAGAEAAARWTVLREGPPPSPTPLLYLRTCAVWSLCGCRDREEGSVGDLAGGCGVTASGWAGGATPGARGCTASAPLLSCEAETQKAASAATFAARGESKSRRRGKNLRFNRRLHLASSNRSPSPRHSLEKHFLMPRQTLTLTKPRPPSIPDSSGVFCF